MVGLETTKELKQLVSLSATQLAISFNHLRRFPAVEPNRFIYRTRSSIMQVEGSEAKPPKRGGSPLTSTCLTLLNAIGKSFSHVVQKEV